MINKKSKLKVVGFWNIRGLQKYIHPEHLVERQIENKELIEKYLRSGNIISYYRGFSLCRICGNTNGFTDLTDGTWIWPEGLAHYISDHNVELPKEFITHMKKNDFNIESKEIPLGKVRGDDTFWINWCSNKKEEIK